jgi:hypothetical protein
LIKEKIMRAASENYPAFSGFQTSCPKCTREGTKSAYRPGTSQQAEHMQRECATCGYTWSEQCADA